MKFSIERSALCAALMMAARAADRRGVTCAILTTVKIEASDSSVEIDATNLDLEIFARIEASVAEAGRCCVPLHRLSSTIAALDTESVEIELDSEGVIVRGGDFSARFGALPAEDFPERRQIKSEARFSIEAEHLRRIFALARPAVSDEETRDYLDGVYFHVAEKDGRRALRTVATDGHRMARVDMPLPVGCPDSMPDLIVPKRAVDVLLALLGKRQAVVIAEIAKMAAAFEVEVDGVAYRFTSKAIDGVFPDYNRAIHEFDDFSVTMDFQEIKRAMRLVLSGIDERRPAIRLEFRESGVTMASKCGDFEASIWMPRSA